MPVEEGKGPLIRLEKPRVEVGGYSLSLEMIEAVARHDVPVTLEAEATTRLNNSIELKDRLVSEGWPVYGVTTGFGDSANQQISPSRAGALQRSLVRMLGCGTGEYAPIDEARATLLIRANCLMRGHSAIRPVIIERLIELLNRDVTPAIREQGSVGASGDLVPLSYVAAVVQGERKVFYEGQLRSTAQVLAATGLEPLGLMSKEALALVNGTSYMSAIAALAARDAHRLAAVADLCTALSVEVLGGMEESFSTFVHDVAKPHPGQALSARHVRSLLEGSQLVKRQGPATQPTKWDGDARQMPRHVQDRYSLRCAPHFIGALWDTLSWVEGWLEIEVNSSNDNPLFDTETGRAINGGNFAGSHVGLAMDGLRTAVASVGDLLDRQLALLVDDDSSNGLPPNLAAQPPAGHPDEGLHHGFKGMQIAASSLVAEALQLCMPATVFSRSTECHNQDKVSMATIGARRTRDAVQLIERATAIHLIALCQAAELRGPHHLGRTRAAYDRVRAVTQPLEGDREMETDIEAVVELMRNGSLSGLVFNAT